MKLYLQTDPRWKDHKFSPAKLTIGGYGCFVTCLAMFDGRTPDVIADLLTNNGAFNAGGMLYSDKAASLLGLQYNGVSKTSPGFTCIAETHYFEKQGYPQHFFVLNPDGSQMDPLGKSIKYPVFSYRLFHKNVDIPTPPVQDNFMKFDLFQQTGQAGIYFRVWGNLLIGIPSMEDFKRYFGDNPKVTKVNDIHEAGTPFEEIATAANGDPKLIALGKAIKEFVK